ncbi:DUF2637 domain-containing protein [Helcobacillus massiliensis]|uniref:DUF2637 domain-containing protein n=1 Tax=Helcobacillus massiliensis TaxID=521392 RepID=UPI002552A53D|nr:DUF2637 domain-containing protein [Helcobacillus massiliensis]MDK7742900.1 DUF2637 domain-containing protein [Helcobacillus massiliensis]WOO93563.1 DUF2637 domain-containing protein [Helcobacillus massiliensis]
MSVTERVAPLMLRRTLIGASATGAGAVALLAFAMSFDALTELARGAGIRSEIAWMWPVVVDGSMVVATAAALVLRTAADRTVRAYPWAQLALFALISVIGNGLHALSSGGRVDLPALVAVAVSGVPPVALLLSTHLLVMMLPRWRWTTPPSPGSVAPRVSAVQEPAVVEPRPTMSLSPEPSSDVSQHEPEKQVPEPEPAEPTTDRAEPVSSPTDPAEPVDEPGPIDEPVALAQWIQDQEDQGKSVSGQVVADRLGVSLSTGKRRLKAAREQLAAQA